MTETERLLRSAYRAFNVRDFKAAGTLMHPDVDWPNAWEGGRVSGRDAVAAYWRRQAESISSEVEPLSFSEKADGKLLSDSRVVHRYQIKGGLIARLDVLDGHRVED